jgi:hypothetical protein
MIETFMHSGRIRFLETVGLKIFPFLKNKV